jgi:hypothetical protein
LHGIEPKSNDKKRAQNNQEPILQRKRYDFFKHGLIEDIASSCLMIPAIISNFAGIIFIHLKHLISRRWFHGSTIHGLHGRGFLEFSYGLL